MWLVGSPEDVARKIIELHEFVGGFGVLLVMGHEWNPKEKWQKSMRLLKEEVLSDCERESAAGDLRAPAVL